MFEPDLDSKEEEEELFVQGRWLVDASEWYAWFLRQEARPPQVVRIVT